MVSQVENSDWLQWMERLVGTPTVTARPLECPPELPRALYHCRLDDQPDFLVPERFLSSSVETSPPDRRLIVNPNCFFTEPGELPAGEDFAGITGDHFAVGSSANSHWIVWVRDSATKAVRPFWLGTEFRTMLDASQAGAPPDIPDSATQVLKAAGVLVKEDQATVQHEEWNRIVAKYATQFRDRGYVAIGRLIHPFHLASLRRYYRYHLRRGAFTLGDTQSTLRFVGYNEPVARFFHHQLTAVVRDIAGEALKPSYCYFASYQGGAGLNRHIDREQCEFSISLCIDYSPEPRLATPWPLHLHVDGGEVRVYQALGDALLYRGRQIPHSRGKLPEGQSSTSIFFHYVRGAFVGALG